MKTLSDLRAACKKHNIKVKKKNLSWHHVWSLSAENRIGVLREGVETTARKALKAMSVAKKEIKK